MESTIQHIIISPISPKQWAFTLALAFVHFQAAMAQEMPAGSAGSGSTTNSLGEPNPLLFTTDAYRQEAMKLLISEANQVAGQLHLQGESPITESNVVFYIPPYGIARRLGGVGTLTTSNYVYCASVGDKFSYLEGTHQDADRWRLYQEYSWPISRLDTNAAYQMATQWLDAVSMDVKGLNEDCNLHVDPTAVRGQGTNAVFLPLYWVYWTKVSARGSVASVEVFAPTKTLMQLRVEDSEYILRKPLVFTNLDELLAQKP